MSQGIWNLDDLGYKRGLPDVQPIVFNHRRGINGDGPSTSDPFGSRDNRQQGPGPTGSGLASGTFDAVMYLASTGEIVNVTIDGTINP